MPGNIIVPYGRSFSIDAGVADKYQPSVGFFSRRTQSKSPINFLQQVDRDMKMIRSKPIGRDLLDLIDKRNLGIGATLSATRGLDGSLVPIPKTVTIKNGFGTMSRDNLNTTAHTRESGRTQEVVNGLRIAGKNHGYAFAGRGANTVTVMYNPEQDYTALLKMKTPSFIALAHELIHAWHWLSGNFDMEVGFADDPVSGMQRLYIKEEAYTVGQGRYRNTRISENSIRAEHNLGERMFYRRRTDCNLAFLD